MILKPVSGRLVQLPQEEFVGDEAGSEDSDTVAMDLGNLIRPMRQQLRS